MISIEWYLGFSALIFVIGAFGMLVRKNFLASLMSSELMLASAILNLAASSAFGTSTDPDGSLVALLCIGMAVPQTVVGLSIMMVMIIKHDGGTNAGKAGKAEKEKEKEKEEEGVEEERKTGKDTVGTLLLGLAVVLGMVVAILWSNLVMFYIGIEFSSISLYLLVGQYRHRQHRQGQSTTLAQSRLYLAGMAGSGFMLYGISMLLLVGSQTTLDAFWSILADPLAPTVGYYELAAWLMLLAGIILKAVVAPVAWFRNISKGIEPPQNN